MPHGKVQETALPEDWKSLQTEYQELDARVDNDLGEHMILYTTLPEQRLNGPSDPDGHTECMVRGNFKAKVKRTPGYPQPVPKVSPGTLVIRQVVENEIGSGLGAFAGRDIKIGELVLAERPLLIKPSEMKVPSTGAVPRHYTAEMINSVVLHEWEKQVKTSVERMSEESKRAFYALANSHTEDGSGPATGICRTNGFELNIDKLTGEKPKPGMVTTSSIYCVVGKDASRINHSCCPNVHQFFSVRSFSLQFRALRNMKAGEQFFYSYCEISLAAKARREKLSPYGFVCRCSACSKATPETDRLRMTYSSEVKRFQELCERVYLNPRFRLTEGVLEPMLKLRGRMRGEGLDATSSYLVLATVLHHVYTALGLQDKAMELGLEAEIEGWRSMKTIREM